MVNLSAPDLTQFPPRSTRVRLGGYAHLPRLLDKARAHLAGKNGEYHYNCPLDQVFFAFTGIDAEALLAALKAGKSDTEMLAWVGTQTRRQPAEIVPWSAWFETHGARSAGSHAWFSERIKAMAADREDIKSYADLLDLDDYVSFGGKG
jgi:hypothetical protein